MRDWIHPKINIGNAALADSFYHRPAIVDSIWRELNAGNHVLLAAPRRVGKTSVMKFMVEKAPATHLCKFEIVQGTRSEAEFYKRIYLMVRSCLAGFEKQKQFWAEIINGVRIEEVGMDGSIKLGGRQIDHLEALDAILPKLANLEFRVILFIDELPEVLHELNKAGKKEEVLSILKNMRRWRQADQFKNFNMVLAGSVGVEHVVKAVTGRTSDINDLGKIRFEPLEEDDALRYLDWATSNPTSTVQYSDDNKKLLLKKVRNFIPFFINLMLDEINKAAHKKKDPNIGETEINEAFDRIVKQNDHFTDWKKRLFEYYPKNEADFMNEILIYVSHNRLITLPKLYDLALKHRIENHYMELVDALEKDGYITESGGIYSFLSPFLEAFWNRQNPVYNG